MNRIVSRPVGRMAVVVTIALFALGTGIVMGWRAPSTGAHAGVYDWWVRDDAPPDVDLTVRPADRAAWSTYIEASNDRLDAWLADPAGAPVLGGTYVTVTFRRPVSITRFSAVIAPLRGRVAQHTAVGEDSEGNRVEEVAFGPPDAAWLAGSNYDPAGGYDFHLDGVIEADLWIGTEASVTPADLGTVRADPAVYLVDTTAIQVLRVDIPAAYGAALAIDNVVMDSPWGDLSW